MDKAERARLVLMVKNRLLVRWLPDKPGGLSGLIELAADAAIDAVTDKTRVAAMEFVALIEATESAALEETESATEDVPLPSTPEDNGTSEYGGPGRYHCPQCAVTHQRSSGVGTRHAHLFYGGPAEVVHLEHCPVLKDAEAVCNCNAVVPSAAQRATDRREP